MLAALDKDEKLDSTYVFDFARSFGRSLTGAYWQCAILLIDLRFRCEQLPAVRCIAHCGWALAGVALNTVDDKMETVDVSTQLSAFEMSRIWVLVSITIVYYDQLLTFPVDIQYFWSRTFSSKSRSISSRASWPVLFFYLCRLLGIVGHVPVAYAAFVHTTPETCYRLQYYHEMFTATSNLIVSTLLILRVYALYEQSRRVLWFLIGSITFLSVGSTALTTFSEFISPELINPKLLVDGNCKIILGHTEGYFVAGSWGCILAFDTLAFILILRRTMTVYKYLTIRNSLFYLMLRDGAVYFGCLVVLYIVNIVTLLFCAPDYKGVLITFTNAIAFVLSGRLMLNIRSAASPDADIADVESDDNDLTLPVVFRSINGRDPV
ncbi:hypothetical protein NM688_g3043 [Phlebia brevispora]|uniref:Uncharacterized protein n=1 Tax=Phlebia brevispora TaxID=194682 RepID=A0ACC1T6N1_9APHY|nr:hypothetical protein NM688_g3043 [Phlebia brevispora]